MIAPLFLAALAPQAGGVDVGGLLAELSDPRSLARFPEPAFRLRLVRAAPGPLLHERSGPGVLVGLSAPDPVIGLRVFVDGRAEPVLARDLASGEALPAIPFARGCRVEADGPGVSGALLALRILPPGTPVQSPGSLDLAGFPPRRRSFEAPVSFAYTLGPNNPAGALACMRPETEKGPHAIVDLRFRIESSDLGAALQKAVLRIAFDGEPRVECRLGDLFAAPRGPPADGWPVLARAGRAPPVGMPDAQRELACSFAMPYRERFELSIDNRGPRDLHVSGSLRTEPWNFDERSLHFCARSRSLPPVAAEVVDERPLWTIAGKGVLVGANGLAPAFLRADGQDVGPLADGFRALDAVPFERALVVEAGRARDAASPVALFWYARPGCRDDAPRIRPEDLELPGLLERK